MTIDTAMQTVVDHAPDANAVAYAEAWLDGSVHERARVQMVQLSVALSTQIRYVLNNVSGWRGELANEVRTALRANL